MASEKVPEGAKLKKFGIPNGGDVRHANVSCLADPCKCRSDSANNSRLTGRLLQLGYSYTYMQAHRESLALVTNPVGQSHSCESDCGGSIGILSSHGGDQGTDSGEMLRFGDGWRVTCWGWDGSAHLVRRDLWHTGILRRIVSSRRWRVATPTQRRVTSRAPTLTSRDGGLGSQVARAGC